MRVRVRNISIMVPGFFLMFLLSSCTVSLKHSDENNIKKDYDITDFNRIEFEGAYNIVLYQGDGPTLAIKTTEDLHEKIRTWVSDSILHIKTSVKNISSDEIKVDIHFNNLDEVIIKGGAFLKTDGYVELNNFNIHIEGGASVDMQVNAETIKAKAEGAVNIDLQGVANEFYASCDGAGNIDADELKTKFVDCRVSGVGNASVYATDELKARVEGLGKISYRGNPRLDKKVDGIGLVYKK